MPFSLFGILLGGAILGFGAILFFATRYKKVAIAVLGLGFLVVLLTVVVMVFAVNSLM
jgi:hypothetical protein